MQRKEPRSFDAPKPTADGEALGLRRVFPRERERLTLVRRGLAQVSLRTSVDDVANRKALDGFVLRAAPSAVGAANRLHVSAPVLGAASIPAFGWHFCAKKTRGVAQQPRPLRGRVRASATGRVQQTGSEEATPAKGRLKRGLSQTHAERSLEFDAETRQPRAPERAQGSGASLVGTSLWGALMQPQVSQKQQRAAIPKLHQQQSQQRQRRRRRMWQRPLRRKIRAASGRLAAALISGRRECSVGASSQQTKFLG